MPESTRGWRMTEAGKRGGGEGGRAFAQALEHRGLEWSPPRLPASPLPHLLAAVLAILSLAPAPLRQLVASLRVNGVRTVGGDVVGDGSYFEPTLVHPNWEAFDLNWWYAAPVSGLGWHDNSVDFDWQPGAAAGAPAQITMTPDL